MLETFSVLEIINIISDCPTQQCIPPFGLSYNTSKQVGSCGGFSLHYLGRYDRSSCTAFVYEA